MVIFKKKTIFCMILLFLTVFCFACDISVLNGIWVRKSGYEWVVNHPEDRDLNDFIMFEDEFNIIWDDSKNEGIFLFGPEQHRIKKLESMADEITMTYGWGNERIVFKVISHDVLQVLSHPYGSTIDFLYRIADPEKPSLAKGLINEDRVRFRNKPDLSSGCFYFLKRGEIVEVIGMSPEKEKIGDMEAYWYEICIGSCDPNTLQWGMFYIMGWVYGAYVDVADKRAFEETHKPGG